MSNTTISLETSDLYTIEFEHRPKYLYAFISGKDDSLEITRSYWQEMLNECRTHRFDKLLVEENLEGSLSMQEVYEFASEYLQMGFRQIIVAFVDRYPEQQQLNRFGELVATNRGGRIRVFDSVTDAKQWLLIN
ncbi:MAG: hypothetical protein ACR2F2_10475 [Pyrinomonadaceae bacterium]